MIKSITTMEKVSYSYTRANLSTILDEVVNNSEVYCIKRNKNREIIMIDKNDYDSMLETSYLFKSPENGKMLLQGLEESDKDMGKKIDL